MSKNSEIYKNIFAKFSAIESETSAEMFMTEDAEEIVIAFGLMALVGILTALDSLLYSLNDSFSDLGSNSFTIERKNVDLGGGGPGRRRKQGVAINYDQAAEL